MTKKVIILAFAGVLVVGGIAWFVIGRDDTKQSQTTNTDTPATSSQIATDAAAFNPIATTDVSYEATLTSTKDGKTFTATLKSDGKGNSEFEAEQSGQEFKMVMTKDAFYSCTGGKCYKLTSREGAAFDPANYQYTTEDINDLRNTATYKGTAACGAATCDVWQVKDANSEGTVYIDQASKRIMKAEGVFDGNKGTLIFTYKPVSISIPKDAQTLPQ